MKKPTLERHIVGQGQEQLASAHFSVRGPIDELFLLGVSGWTHKLKSSS